jgi:hypothetical protein
MVPVEEISPTILRSEDRIERVLLLLLPPEVGRVTGAAVVSAGLENIVASLGV